MPSRGSKRPFLAGLAGVLLGLAAASAWALTHKTSVSHTVDGNILVSDADPAVRIVLPASARYGGRDDWELAAYSDFISLFPFADVDSARHVQHLYWIQFEAYSPEHPELHHTYTSTRHMRLGGMDFLVDTWTESSMAKAEPDSDTSHLRGLLKTQGYVLPPSTMAVRFVHLMDGARKELMYIYSEPTPSGLTAEDLKRGGKAYGRWPELERGLIERGRHSIRLQPLKGAQE